MEVLSSMTLQRSITLLASRSGVRRQAASWRRYADPQAVTPGFIGGQFGFNLTGPTNAVIVIEATTNLSNPV